MPFVQCQAEDPNGEQCQDVALPGDIRCEYHGGQHRTATIVQHGSPLPDDRSVRCSHVKRTGNPCTRPVVRGQSVCWAHVPEELRAALLESVDEAKAHLIEMQGRSLIRLEELLDDEDPRIRMQAVTQVLDRLGVIAPKRDELTVHHEIRPDEAAVDDTIERLIARARSVDAESQEVPYEELEPGVITSHLPDEPPPTEV